MSFLFIFLDHGLILFWPRAVLIRQEWVVFTDGMKINDRPYPTVVDRKELWDIGRRLDTHVSEKLPRSGNITQNKREK